MGSTEGLVICINLNKDSLHICSASIDQRDRKLHRDWTGKEDLGGSPQPLPGYSQQATNLPSPYCEREALRRNGTTLFRRPFGDHLM